MSSSTSLTIMLGMIEFYYAMLICHTILDALIVV